MKKLIAGLGNPGVRYDQNRHNFGFMVLDAIAVDLGLTWRKSRDLMGFVTKKADEIYIKPTTYMNDSGETVQAAASFYGVVPEHILVIHDDLDLEFGKIRLSFGGSSAGHHGVDSVIERLGTPDFARLRIGIGHPKGGGAVGHVLDNFSDHEKKELKKTIETCLEAVRSYIEGGIGAAMNRFN